MGYIADSLEVMNHAWFKDFDWTGLTNMTLVPPYDPLSNNINWEQNFDPEFIQFKPNDSMSQDECVNLDKYKKDFELFEYE